MTRPTVDRAADFMRYWLLFQADCAWLAQRPDPEPEYRFDAVRKWRFDFAWPMQHVAVEVDGGQWAPGGGRHGSDRDREKINAAAVQGWRVMHFSPKQLDTDPAGCVEAVMAALGWKP